MARPGYIKMYRQIEDNPLWLAEPFSKGQAWMDLIMLANFAPADVMIKNTIFHIERGQLIRAQESLANRWKWGIKKVRHFLKVLKDQNMIEAVGRQQGTLITIVNYEKYQGDGQGNGSEEGSSEGEIRAEQGQQYKKNKEKDKENNNNNKGFDMNLISEYPDSFRNVITKWMDYKNSTDEPYNNVSMEVWLEILAEKYRVYKEKDIADVIRMSIANQYKNVAWNMLTDAARKKKEKNCVQENSEPKDYLNEEERQEKLRILKETLNRS